MSAAALLATISLASGPGPIERIALIEIEAEQIPKQELDAVYRVLEKAVAEASRACVISQHRIKQVKARGEDPRQMVICGLPLPEAMQVSHLVFTTLDRLRDKYVFTIKLTELKPAKKLAHANQVSKNLNNLLRDIPDLIQKLFVSVPGLMPPAAPDPRQAGTDAANPGQRSPPPDHPGAAAPGKTTPPRAAPGGRTSESR